MDSPRRRSALRPVHVLWLVVPVLLWWALRDIRFGDVWTALRRLHLWQIIALIATNTLTLLAFAGRWWVIVRAQGYAVPYLALTRYRVASFGVSYFTPGPQFGGEPLQVFLLQHRHGVPGPAAVASTAMDKTLELLVNCTFLAFGLLVVVGSRVAPEVARPPWAGALLVLLAAPLAFLASAWWGWHPLTRLLERLPARVARAPAFRQAHTVVQESEQQIADLCRRQPRALMLALLISLLSWGLILFEYWMSLSFLGLDLTAPQLVIALTLNRLAFLAPLPGGLGALESSQVLAMQVLGLAPAIGVSQALLIRARDILVGGLGLWWGGQDATRRHVVAG